MNNVKKLAKMAFQDYLRKNTDVRVKDIEAEVINLMWYLILRQNGDIQWSLPFLDEQLIQSIITSNDDVMQGVTEMAMEGFPQSYNEGNAFVAIQGVTMNIASMSVNDSSNFLRDYFNGKH